MRTIRKAGAKPTFRELWLPPFLGKMLPKERVNNTPVLFQKAHRTLYFGLTPLNNQGENENEVRGILLSIVRTTECCGLGTICSQDSGVGSGKVRRSFV